MSDIVRRFKRVIDYEITLCENDKTLKIRPNVARSAKTSKRA